MLLHSVAMGRGADNIHIAGSGCKRDDLLNKNISSLVFNGVVPERPHLFTSYTLDKLT